MLNIVLLIIFSAGLLFLLQWYLKKELIDPLFFTSVYWIVFIVFSVFISIQLDFTFYWYGIVPIVLLLLAFLSGSFVMKQLRYNVSLEKPKKQNEIIEKKDFSCSRLKWLILIFSAMGFLVIFLQLQFLGIQIRSFTDLLVSANKISVIRYNGQQDMPKIGLVLMAFLYSAGFFSGIYNVIAKGTWNKIISLIPFVVILVFTMTNGVKTGFLFLLVIWISGYAAAYVHERKGEIKKIGKLMLRGVAIIFIMLSLIPLTQVMRGGKSKSKVVLVSAGTLSYFGSFNAFTIWYNSYKNDEFTGYKYTLSGIHNFFHGEREVGLYGKDNVEIGEYNDAPIKTNVFTMTRGLIQDFTLFGAMAFLFVVGIIMQIIYDRTKRKNALAMGILALFYSIVLWSFTVNIINYNTIILSWMISLALIFFVKKQNSSVSQTIKE